MKILVCISNVPDTTTKITFANNNKDFNTAGVQFIINPYDEIGLTRALELKEAMGGTVTVINVGAATTEPNIRKALAIGADDAIRVNAEPTDAYFVATQIAEVAKKNGYDIILTGRESIDYNGGQVAGMIAELLGMPSVSVATKLDVAGTEATLEREIDGGKEVVKMSLPLVASAQKGMAEPRIPNMRGIMTARTKPLTVVEPVGADMLTSSAGYELPPAKSACKYIKADNIDELVNLLHTEAKVI
ncbi:MAG: electron transfer flavoprotein subunit beta/FixA family protein [Bacteroidetes bacterium]|nr:electron transfer flavoprotein subunit beta/FixA family protein [Bacteroidota bacterium]